jgi:hypothetical protein
MYCCVVARGREEKWKSDSFAECFWFSGIETKNGVIVQVTHVSTSMSEIHVFFD